MNRKITLIIAFLLVGNTFHVALGAELDGALLTLKNKLVVLAQALEEEKEPSKEEQDRATKKKIERMKEKKERIKKELEKK